MIADRYHHGMMYFVASRFLYFLLQYTAILRRLLQITVEASVTCRRVSEGWQMSQQVEEALRITN